MKNGKKYELQPMKSISKSKMYYMKKPKINIYQLFRREFGGKEDNFLELAFTYLLKCYYFPKYLRPEYFWEQEEEISKKLTGEDYDNYDYENKEWQKWQQKVRPAYQFYNDYCYDGIFSKEFIKYMIEFMPSQPTLNKITDEEVKQLKQAWDLLPKEWKEKRPWYPLSYCDLALDDCLIEVKWKDKEEITEKELERLVSLIHGDKYDFRNIKKIGIYFAKQGRLFICDKWGCPDDITSQDFHEKFSIETLYSRIKSSLLSPFPIKKEGK